LSAIARQETRVASPGAAAATDVVITVECHQQAGVVGGKKAGKRRMEVVAGERKRLGESGSHVRDIVCIGRRRRADLHTLERRASGGKRSADSCLQRTGRRWPLSVHYGAAEIINRVDQTRLAKVLTEHDLFEVRTRCTRSGWVW